MTVPYISRPQAEAFLQAFANAVQQPQQSPVVFHIWGVGGVGKTTLTRKLQEAHREASIAEVLFGVTEGIDDPIGLMTTLYEKVSSRDSWHDPFWEKYELYQETLHKLKTEPPSDKGKVSEEQTKYIEQLANHGANAAGELLKESTEKTAIVIAGEAIKAVAPALALTGSLVQFLMQHRATKRDKQLQEFMLKPLPKLTKAFAEGLSQKAKQQPVILVLDAYEKVPSPIDLWLWRSLIGNTELSQHPVRLVISGRHSILKGEGWRKLSQDWAAVNEQQIERFTLEQTQTYLQQIGKESEKIQDIYQVTKGLPYYLNWIREQYWKGQQLDFAQGNQEVVRLLLQGLNNTQKQVVQLAACCWKFDRKLIQYLVQQQHLDFATAVDPQQNCFEWLIQNAFVEQVQHEFRLDDVARDVFRLSLWQDDRDSFGSVHEALAQYFEAVSDREASPTALPPDKYENPDWLIPRFQFLYYLLFTRRQDVQHQLITHLLEARYFDLDDLVQVPVKLAEAEYALSEHPMLNHATWQFLTRMRPAIDYGWAVLEEDPIDYPHNIEKYGLSKADIDRAIEQCLGQLDRLSGLARFMALFCKSRRCIASESYRWLIQAKEQVKYLETPIHPEFSSLLLWKIANALFELERYEEAIDSYDRLLAINSNRQFAWYNRGLAFAYLERYQEAINSYIKALEVEPKCYEVYYSQGVVLNKLERYEEAIESYNKALNIKPDDYVSWNDRGAALAQVGYCEEAIESYNKALEIKPNYQEAWYNQGVTLYNLGRYEEAVNSWKKAPDIKPDLHESWCYLGLALDELGRYEEAIGSYNEALKIKPDYYIAWYNRGFDLANIGQFEEAVDSYDKAIGIQSENYEVWFYRSIALGELGNYEEAVNSCNKALAIKQGEDAVWYIRGLALAQLKLYEKAIESYDQAIAIKPDNHLAWYNRGSALADIERYEEAVYSWNKVLEIEPGKDEAWYKQGLALCELGQCEEAIKSFDRALAIKSDLNVVWNDRGVILHGLWRYEEAIESYNRALDIDPNDEVVFYNKACCYSLWSQPDKAIEFLQRAIELNFELRETAKTEVDFDSIRTHDRFKALIEDLDQSEAID